MIKAVVFCVVFLLTNASVVLLFPLSRTRFFVCFAVYAIGTTFMLWVLFHPRSQWLSASRWRVECSGRPCIALTFDDGPTRFSTPRLLRILREKEVRATFFVIGKRGEEQAELLARVCADGHLIANHTYSHPLLFCFLTPSRLRDEIDRGQEAIQRISGVRPRFFRPPAGLKHPLLGLYLRRAGLELISWRLRAFDTLPQKPEVLKKRIVENVAPGDIILLHDNASAGAGVTLSVLPCLIDELRTRGFEFVLVR
jgi:peptidoglycan/xylan/chitin deacetylase (PgdA/CDA1 family)